jgi:hypothetical protein
MGGWLRLYPCAIRNIVAEGIRTRMAGLAQTFPCMAGKMDSLPPWKLDTWDAGPREYRVANTKPPWEFPGGRRGKICAERRFSLAGEERGISIAPFISRRALHMPEVWCGSASEMFERRRRFRVATRGRGDGK